ncbi:MAG: glycine--tRNA ligase, partial [Candidatus Thermoplasmatota archaeon]|nr:glycine--tRNA ligase [Candidatus Thermoplasmatota archaeon]
LHYLSSKFQLTDPGGDVLLSGEIRCRGCNSTLHEHAKIGPFNLMFATQIGPGGGQQGYIRPETAQGMFVTFDWLYRYHRERVPFGAVQIGRAYRNEISPRQGLIRLREFWQAEAEVFVDPDEKDHPRFHEVANLEVMLVPDSQPTVEMALGDAVEKGVIANETVAYFVAKTYRILTEAGLDPDRIRFRQHESDEMAHYASDCWDAEFHSARYGWVECVGIADRGCYDLEAHEEHAGQQLKAFRRYDEAIEQEVTRILPDMAKLGPVFKGQAKAVADALEAMDPEEITPGEPITLTLDGDEVEVPADAYEVEETTERITGEWFTPHVIEPSYGIDRILFAVLEHSFDPTGEWDTLRLPAWMAPIQVGVLPLVGKDGLPEQAEEIQRALRNRGLITYYDSGGSIGRRYARLDEAGTPLAVTIDHQTVEGEGVTVRERDSQEQVRVGLDGLPELLEDLIHGRRSFDEL